MSDLYVSAYAPQLENGRDLRTYTLVRALAAAGPLDLAYVPFGGDDPAPAFQQIEGVAFHRIVPSRGARRARGFAHVLARGVPLGLARGSSPELAGAVARLADEPGRGRIIAGDLTAMVALEGLARRRPVVYSAHNLESSFTSDIYGGAMSRALLRRLERRVLREVAESWMVSERDLQGARELCPDAALRYVPNVADVAAIEPVAAPASGTEVLMVGDFTWPPNAAGLAWLRDEVLPRVAERVPSVRVRVVGRGQPEGEPDDPRLDRRGFVPTLRDAYAGVAAVAVPLTESGGTPLKFVEALAYGVPVVATAIAAQGLAVRPGEHFRLGADADAFAAELADLLEHGDAPMAARARELAQREYSVEALERLVQP